MLRRAFEGTDSMDSTSVNLIINDFQTYDADVQYGGTNTGLSHYSLWGEAVIGWVHYY